MKSTKFAMDTSLSILELQLEQIRDYGFLSMSRFKREVIVEYSEKTADPAARLKTTRFTRHMSWDEIESIYHTIEINTQANRGDRPEQQSDFVQWFRNACALAKLLDYLHEYGNTGFRIEGIRFNSLRHDDAEHTKRVANLVELIQSHQNAWKMADGAIDGIEILETPQTVNLLFDRNLKAIKFEQLAYPKRPPFLSVENLVSLAELRRQNIEDFELCLRVMFGNTWMARNEVASMGARITEVMSQKEGQPRAYIFDGVLITALSIHYLIRRVGTVQVPAKSLQQDKSARESTAIDIHDERNNIVEIMSGIRLDEKLEIDRTHVIRVKNPSHAMHVFWPCFYLANTKKGKAQRESQCVFFYQILACNEKTDFLQFIQDVKLLETPKESGIHDVVFAIFLPEFLNDGQYDYFLQFLRARLVPIPDKEVPRMLIITSDTFPGDASYFTDLTVNDSRRYEEQIALFRNVSAYLHKNKIFLLVTSDVPGGGKTEAIKSKWLANSNSFRSCFVSSEHQSIPDLSEPVHMQFSREVLTHGNEFWQTMLLLTQLGYAFDITGKICLWNARDDDLHIVFESPRVVSESEAKIAVANNFPFSVQYFERTSARSSVPVHQIQDDSGKIPWNQVCKLARDLSDNTRSTDLDLKEFIAFVYHEFSGEPLNDLISKRTLAYVQSYLSEYLHLFNMSVQTIPKFRGSDRDVYQAIFLVMLTASACYQYKELEFSSVGFVTVLVENLFCDEGQKKPIIITTETKEAVRRNLNAVSQIDLAQKLDVMAPYFKYAVRQGSQSQSDNSETIQLMRSVFCTSDFYKDRFNEMIIEKQQRSRQTITTWPYLFRFSVIVSRIHLAQPVLLSGETGCGKTSLVSFIRDGLSLQWNEQGHELNTRIADALNFHGTVCQNEFDQYMKKIKISTQKTVAFCDEVNTSNDSALIEHAILNWQQSVKPIISFIGAVNLFGTLDTSDSVTSKLARVGMPQLIKEQKKRYTMKGSNEQKMCRDMSSFRYHVHKLERSSEQIQVDCNPRCLTDNEEPLYPDEEKRIVESMIINSFRDKFPAESGQISEAVRWLVDMVHKCVSFIRKIMDERAVISYRDIERVIALSHYLFSAVKDKDVVRCACTSFAITIVVLFCLRLPAKQILVPSGSHILRVLEKDPGHEASFSAREALLERLPSFRGFENLMATFDRFAFWYNWPVVTSPKIWLFKSTIYHLTVMRLCVECKLACAIIGMPGTSKSFAVDLLEAGGMIKGLRLFKYMSSRSASADGIKSEYYDAGYLIARSGNKDCLTPVLFIDEMGLGNINPNKPFKFLHSILDMGIEMNDDGYHVMIPTIGVSNYALDFANMNRMVLVFTELPSIAELTSVFAFARFRSSCPKVLQDVAALKIDPEDPASLYSNEFSKAYGKISSYLSVASKTGLDAAFVDQYNKVEKFFAALWPEQVPDSISLRAIYTLQELVSNSDKPEIEKLFSMVGLELINGQRLRDGANAKERCENLSTQTSDFLEKLGCAGSSGKGKLSLTRWQMFADRAKDTLQRKGQCLLTNGYSIVDFENMLSTGCEFLFAEDFQQPWSDLTFRALGKIIEMYIVNSASMESKKLIIVGNHPVLDSVLDLLNGYDEGHQVLIGSGFTTSVPLGRRVDIILIAELSELNDQNNPFSLPFLDRTQMDYIDWTDLPFGANEFDGLPVEKVAKNLRILAGQEPSPDSLREIVSLKGIIDIWKELTLEKSASSAINELRFLSRSWAGGVRAVINTRANLTQSELGLGASHVYELVDDAFQSFSHLENELSKISNERPSDECNMIIIYKCSKFKLLHHQHLKTFFSNCRLPRPCHIFIIYYQLSSTNGGDDVIPATPRWPVFKIEDITEYQNEFRSVVGGKKIDEIRDDLVSGKIELQFSQSLVSFIIDFIAKRFDEAYGVAERQAVFTEIVRKFEHGSEGDFLRHCQWRLGSNAMSQGYLGSKHAALIQDVRKSLETVMVPFLRLLPSQADIDLYGNLIEKVIAKLKLASAIPLDDEYQEPFMSLFGGLCRRLIRNEIIDFTSEDVSFLIDLSGAVPEDYLNRLFELTVQRCASNCNEIEYNGMGIVDMFAPFRKVIGVNLPDLTAFIGPKQAGEPTDPDKVWHERLANFCQAESVDKDPNFIYCVRQFPATVGHNKEAIGVRNMEEVRTHHGILKQALRDTDFEDSSLIRDAVDLGLDGVDSLYGMLLGMLSTTSENESQNKLEAALDTPAKGRTNSYLAQEVLRFAVASGDRELRERFRALCIILDPITAQPKQASDFIGRLQRHTRDLTQQDWSLAKFEERVELSRNTAHFLKAEDVTEHPELHDNAHFKSVVQIIDDIWSRLLLSPPVGSPILHATLSLHLFLKRYRNIISLLEMVWTLRTEYTSQPVVLDILLHCCCLVGNEMLCLQRLEMFHGRWGSISVPGELPDGTVLSGLCAYSQLELIFRAFFKEYNQRIKNLAKAAGAAVRVEKVTHAFPECVIHPGFFVEFIKHVSRSRSPTNWDLEQELATFFGQTCTLAVVEWEESGVIGLTRESRKLLYPDVDIVHADMSAEPQPKYALLGLLLLKYGGDITVGDFVQHSSSLDEEIKKVRAYFEYGKIGPGDLLGDMRAYVRQLPSKIRQYIVDRVGS